MSNAKDWILYYVQTYLYLFFFTFTTLLLLSGTSASWHHYITKTIPLPAIPCNLCLASVSYQSVNNSIFILHVTHAAWGRNFIYLYGENHYCIASQVSLLIFKEETNLGHLHTNYAISNGGGLTVCQRAQPLTHPQGWKNHDFY